MNAFMKMKRMAVRSSLLLVFPILANCAGEGEATAAVEAAVDTIGGIEHLHYPETSATTLPWRFDTVAVIGGFGVDDPNYQFGQVSRNGLAADAAGNLYVFDNQGKRILGFTPAGEFIGSWGREGEGPGEIGAWSGALAIGVGDTLWLADAANQRITLFPIDGGDAASIPLPEGSTGFGGRLETTPDGVLSLMSSFTFSPGTELEIPPRPLLEIARDGSITDTVWTVPAPEMDLVTITTGNRTMMSMVSRRFSPGFSYGRFSDGGLVLHDQADYDIRMLASDGGAERIITRDPAPRATTDEDRQREIDEILEPRDGEVSDMQRKQAEAMTFADVIAPINRLMLDHRDRVWVGVSEVIPGDDDRIDVFTRDGELIGELRDTVMPDAFLGDGYAALITQDELDVQQIVVLKLVESP